MTPDFNSEFAISITDLWISTNRQREVLDVSDLVASIEANGQLQSIVVTNEPGPDGQPWKVLAGARRTTAMRELGFMFVRAHKLSDLPPHKQQIIELHENVVRENLTWQDEAVAIARYSVLRGKEENAKLSIEQIADELRLPRTQVSRAMTITPYIVKSSPLFEEKLAQAETISAACNVVARREQNRRTEATNNLIAATMKPAAQITVSDDDEADLEINVETPPTVEETSVIVRADFVSWASEYADERFDFIHCDFPYGINFKGANTARVEGSHHGQYSDTADVFESLLWALVNNVERLAASQCHLLFWFDMRYYERIIEVITDRTDFALVTPSPIVWGRSDNQGIVSDVERRPRHIYEVALLFSRGDRKVRQVISDCIWSPSLRNDRDHRSEKPEPMLRQLLPAFIDSSSHVLDPTAGSGAALCVADELGAARVVGVELNEDFASRANSRINASRALRLLSRSSK